MNVLCTICARGGSKGLLNKNIKKLNGKPLLNYTIEHAIKSKIFSDILVSSDDEKIINLSKKFKFINIIKRPKKLASDKSGKLDVIKHAVITLEQRLKKNYDIIIDLDVTAPLRNISDIRNALKLFLNKDASVLLSATLSRKNPYFNQVIETKNGVKLVMPKIKYLRRQDSPRVYDLNASIYIFKKDLVLRSNTIYSRNSILYKMPEERSIDIDTLNDFHYVEYLMKNSKKNA